MSADLPDGGSERGLNRAVAITVVILSVFMGISKVKDDNIVQAMQQAKADANDRWSQYEALRTKLHVAETARQEIALIGLSADPGAAPQVRAALSTLDASIAKYGKEGPQIQAQARGNEGRYDALNIHDDQFDLSDALISIALSLAAVAALTEQRWLLWSSWAAAAAGLVMGVAGFFGWSLHPDALAALLS